MNTDSELLCEYAQKGNEAAFAELVRRYVNLVYAAALRVTNGDAALAEDAAQAAFTELARKAGELTGRATLAGWLHTTARFLALRGVRTEQRRRVHEQEANAMNDPSDAATSEISWEQLRPVLDEAVGDLGEEDRDAVLLRYFQGKSHREVGEALGLNENTARMRVERAVDKLRAQFSRRGVTTTATLLASTLGLHGASPVSSASLAATITGKSLTTAGEAGPRATVISAKRARPTDVSKPWLAAAVVIIIVGAVGLAWLHHNAAPAPTPTPSSVPAVVAVKQVEMPTASPAVVAAKPDHPADPNDLGVVNFGIRGARANTFTLSSGLIFAIGMHRNNASGTISLSYGAYEPGKPMHRRAEGLRGGELPSSPLKLNMDYDVTVPSGLPIAATLPDGVVVRFTPEAPKLDVNKLGVVSLTPGNPLKFTLHSGKILTLSLTWPDNSAGNQATANIPSQDPNVVILTLPTITEKVYPSEEAYEANKSSSGGAGTAPRSGTEFQYDIQQGTHETVTFTPVY